MNSLFTCHGNFGNVLVGAIRVRIKKALRDVLKSYLQSTPAGVVTNGRAIKKLYLLIALHHDAERKIEVGVDYFKIKRNALGAGNGFGWYEVMGANTASLMSDASLAFLNRPMARCVKR